MTNKSPRQHHRQPVPIRRIPRRQPFPLHPPVGPCFSLTGLGLLASSRPAFSRPMQLT